MTSATEGNAKQADVTVTQLIFGGKGGDQKSTGDVGGKQLAVYGGSEIDSIRIDNQQYGGGGGKQQITARIPANGAIAVTRLGTRGNVVSFMQLQIDGTTYEAGDKDGSDCLLEMPPFAVRFNTIFCGARVDKLIFDIVGQP